MYMCGKVIHFSSVSTIFLLDSGTVLTESEDMVFLFFLFDHSHHCHMFIDMFHHLLHHQQDKLHRYYIVEAYKLWLSSLYDIVLKNNRKLHRQQRK